MSKPPMTVFASAALRIAATLTAQVHGIRLGRDPVRKVKVVEPDGPSTAGGKQGRHAMVLAPESGTGQSLMFGWFNVGTSEAEMRSFESLAEQFQARFDKPIDIDQEAYDELCSRIAAYLSMEGYEVSSSTQTPKAPAGKQHAPPEATAASTPPVKTTPQAAPIVAGAEQSSKTNFIIMGLAIAALVLGVIAGVVITNFAGG